MGYWVMFVAGLVAVVRAEDAAAPVAAAAAEPAKMVYYGLYKDSCGADGLYYKDEASFVVCDHGKAHVQPCAPGSYNDKMENYKEQDSYAMTSFCGNIYARPPPMHPGYHHYHGYYNHHAPYYHGYYHHPGPYYYHGYHHAYPPHQYHNDVNKLAYQKPYQKHPAPAQPGYEPAQPAPPVAQPAHPQPEYKAEAAQPAPAMPAKPAAPKPGHEQKKY